MYAARQARLTGGKSRSLYKELNTMTDGNVEKLGDEIFRAYAARAEVVIAVVVVVAVVVIAAVMVVL